MAEWTHKKLVRRMAQWLKGTKRMSVVVSELATRVSETPDVIGWQSGETTAPSILIECKVSRSDFCADGKKLFRRYASMGMGDLRYVAAPKGLLTPEEMPDGWGLLEVDRFVRVSKEAAKMPACKGRECVMLVSAIRRLEIATAVYVVHEDTENAALRGAEGVPSNGVVVRCQSCGWTGSNHRLRQVHRPPDPSAFWVCPDCGSDDVPAHNTTITGAERPVDGAVGEEVDGE